MKNNYKIICIVLYKSVYLHRKQKQNIMKNYPKELIEEFKSIELYVCECGHTTSEMPTRGTGDGDYWTPEGVEHFCPECDRIDSFSEATIEDYVYQLDLEGINIEDYN